MHEERGSVVNENISLDTIHKDLEALKRESNILNGSAKYVKYGTGGGLVAIIGSLFIWWLGFQPTLATKDYVKDHVRLNAPFVEDKKVMLFRLDSLEFQSHKKDKVLGEINGRLQNIEIALGVKKQNQ